MNQAKLILLMAIASMVLSACVVRPAHRPVKVVAKPVKTVVVLDNEHQQQDIVIVKVKPAKTKHCWQHKQHWHCDK